MVVEALAARRGLDFVAGGTSYAVAGSADTSDALVLLKPLTYMNRSDQGLLAWAADRGLSLPQEAPDQADGPPADGDSAGDEHENPAMVDPEAVEPTTDVGPDVRLMVVCDDLALPLGAVRLRARGSSGGQNGLASIIDALGSEEVPRLRLGINADGEVPPAAVWPDYVLSDFAEEETAVAAEVVAHACDALEYWLDHDCPQTASRFNRRRAPDPD